MAHPEYILWALVLFGVLPLAPINRVAALVVAARLATQGAYDFGWPEAQSQTLIYGVCAIIALHNARLFTCFLAAALFVPLAVASAWQLQDAYHGWWAVFWLAVAQCVALVVNGEWRKAVRHWLDASDPDKDDVLYRLIAFARRAWTHA
jgi:hypothetical protein